MNNKIRFLAAVLALILLLTGCSVETPAFLKMLVASYVPTHFDDMEYTRPDVEALLDSVDTCESAADAEHFAELALAVTNCLMLYNEYLTNYQLANIHYYNDMTDIYWSDEYNFCLDYNSEISAAVDQMLYVLADSPHREALESDELFGEDYFDDYDGESLWDETFTGLMDQENLLMTDYYDLSAQAAEVEDAEFRTVYAPLIGEVLVKLVVLRQEIAAYAGDDSYQAFAYDFY